MNKKNLKIIILTIIIIIWLFNRIFKKESWNFVGYQYRWSKNYVENTGFASQMDCVRYGDNWIKKQKSDRPLYTCSLNCKPDNDIPGIDICKKICEYEDEGLVRCRK